MDCDPDAAVRSIEFKEEFPQRFRFEDASFRILMGFPSEDEFDGILMDLGISSFQLMEPEKGFFWLDAPIDMRLDPRTGQSAAEFLESASRESLVRAVRNMERKKVSRVVNAIIDAKGTGVLGRTMSGRHSSHCSGRTPIETAYSSTLKLFGNSYCD